MIEIDDRTAFPFKTRPVTENDLRQPQFRNKNIDDFEFDSTGEIVQKDRFETTVRHAASIFQFNFREGWKCNDVVHCLDAIGDFINDVNQPHGAANLQAALKNLVDQMQHYGSDIELCDNVNVAPPLK